MRFPFYCWVIFFISHCHFSFSQVRDFQTWSSVSVIKSAGKKFKISIDQELRLRDNSTRLRTSFTDIGVKYELLKDLDIAIAYRLIFRQDVVDHRVYTDISYDLKMNKWTLEHRIRFQHEFEAKRFEDNYLRPKLTISHEISKHWEAFAATEFFYHIFHYKGDAFDEYRLSAGTSYHFNKKHEIKVYYLLEQEFNVNGTDQNHVLGLGYSFRF